LYDYLVVSFLCSVGESRMCSWLVGRTAARVDILAESQSRAWQHSKCQTGTAQHG